MCSRPFQDIMDQASSNTVRIDGDRIKAIRLEKGLTQLYLASFVGVTTDTISRWENRKIPSIKRENAIKLAEALEVSLDEIIQKPEEEERAEEKAEEVRETAQKRAEERKEERPPEPKGPIRQPESDTEPEKEGVKPGKTRISPWLFIMIGVILAGSGLFLKLFMPEPSIEPDDIELTRLLPGHAPAGTVIPVILEIDSFAPEDISMIITETIPRGGVPVASLPPFKKFQQKAHSLKWIYRTTDDDDGVIAYLVRIPKRDGRDGRLRFSGRVRVKLGLNSLEKEIGGRRYIEISACHWADDNCDEMIDDEEILAVYDRYGEIKIFDQLLKEAEDIWTEGGYEIDERTGKARPAVRPR